MMAYILNRADYCTEQGAKALAEVLTARWRAQGHDVKFWIEEQKTSAGESIWRIRSDLVRGQPRKP